MAIKEGVIPKGLLGWKCTRFKDWDPSLTMQPGNDSGDWSGIYVAPAKSVAEGYSVDYLDDTGAGSAYFHEVCLIADMKVLICDDALMGDGKTSGEDKAAHFRSGLPAAIRSALPSGFLVPALGTLGYAVQCFHDEDLNVEIIIPNSLARQVVMAGTHESKYKGWMKI